MSNILDYLNWRGDLPLANAPFCNPDNLILSYLAYVNLDHIAPSKKEEFITVKEASSRFFHSHTEEELKEDCSFIHMAPCVLKAMAESRRFSGAQIGNYQNVIDVSSSLQFSAIEVRLEDHTTYIAFRGTDDTIVGWKEDFNLSNGVVPAQEKAVEYLNEAGRESDRPLRVGGHSKGGNLCIYAAAKCDNAVKNQITEIYCNDGPGFTEGFMEEEGYRHIKGKIIRIIPECSIIGMLLKHDVKPIIIASSQKGVLQHDGMSWNVLGASFVQKEAMDSKTTKFVEIIDSWISGMDKEKREDLIHSLFSILESTGAETLTELQKGNMRDSIRIIKQIVHLNPETRESVEALITSLFEHYKYL